MKRFFIGMIIPLSLFSITANANNLCENLPGQWFGKGRLEVDLIDGKKRIKCMYRGISNVTSRDSKVNAFNSEFNMELMAGMCPKQVVMSLPGVCYQGFISMRNSDGSTDLKGRLRKSGNAGKLSGKLALEADGRTFDAYLVNAVLYKDHG